MHTKVKSFFSKIRLWMWLTALGVFLIGTAVVLALCLPGGSRVPADPTEAITVPTAPTEPRPTLPPNPYGPESFSSEGGFLTCLEGESMLGVDISDWQGLVDWKKAKADGIEFVMIRVGRRGTDLGGLYIDEYAQANYEGARKEGILVGAYFFSQAITPQEAVEEAEFLMDAIRDWELDLPVAFDWEHLGDDCRTKDVDPLILTQCAAAFCERVEQEGYRGMVYFNPDYAIRRLDLTQLMDYAFWFAYYDENMIFPYRVDMWQYTQSGRVDGVGKPDENKKVDINLWLIYDDEEQEGAYAE